jgi:hypothetical protein
MKNIKKTDVEIQPEDVPTPNVANDQKSGQIIQKEIEEN